MPLRLIAGPAAQPVDLAEAKRHLLYETSDQDLTIAAYVAAATATLDGPRGELSRCLVAQKWALDLDAFPRCDQILLPLPPTISIDAVKYVDQAGVSQVFDPAAYVGHVGELGLVELLQGGAWPAVRTQRRAVSIEFTAGFGPPSACPADLKAAILLMTGDLFKNRETTVEGVTSTAVAMSTTVERLVRRYRVIGG